MDVNNLAVADNPVGEEAGAARGAGKYAEMEGVRRRDAFRHQLDEADLLQHVTDGAFTV